MGDRWEIGGRSVGDRWEVGGSGGHKTRLGYKAVIGRKGYTAVTSGLHGGCAVGTR